MFVALPAHLLYYFCKKLFWKNSDPDMIKKITVFTEENYVPDSRDKSADKAHF